MLRRLKLRNQIADQIKRRCERVGFADSDPRTAQLLNSVFHSSAFITEGQQHHG